ncbi:MAG: ABC transporter ATP-binding protein [Actinomycetota bacterium]
MAAETQDEADTGFSWGRVVRLFGPHRARVALVVVLVVLTSGIGIVNPLLIQVVFDDALFPGGGEGPDVGLLVTLTVAMLLITVLGGALGVWQTIATNRLGQEVLRDLRDRLYGHLQSLSLSFYAGARTGELQSRITSDVGGVQTAVTNTLSSILSNLVTFVSAFLAMMLLSWQLTLISLATVPFFVLATRAVGSRRERLTSEAQAATAEMTVITQETLSVSGIVLSRVFGQRDREVGRFRDANRRLADVATRQQVIGQAFFTTVQAFLGATPVLVYLVAGLLIDGGTGITAGTIVAVTTLQNRLFFPVARLLETTVELQSSRALFRRIFGYLDIEPDITEPTSPVPLPRHETIGRLTLDEVVLVHDPDRDPPVPSLDGVDLVADPGQLVALVGPSGAGKSTILNLVARLYDPTSGRVLLDDVDLRNLRLESLAELVGFVTQESYLFAGTLRDNIAYGTPDASDGDIVDAAVAAAIHDRIEELPEGYDTVVGERGTRLSGGERQRVAIARVLLSDPKVLLLDEATSALDTASERRIQRALSTLVRDRTTIAVAHRLSTIQAADAIHVIERGRIVESGTHDELLDLGGSYRALYREQFGDGEIETRCADGFIMANGDCVAVEEQHEALHERIRRMRERVAG